MKMLRQCVLGTLISAALLMLSGCGNSGDKANGFAWVYAVTVVLSFLLLGAYCMLIKKKDSWMLLLFAAIFVTNCGYLSLSVSQSLEEALLANRIAYFGSVFLSPAMLMIVIRACDLKYKKWTGVALVLISIAVFAVTATPGYSDIYYSSAVLETINGTSVLKKVYGPWHSLYLFYLLAHFASMIAVLIYVVKKKKLRLNIQSVILVVAVLGNIGVWLLEQLVNIDFEFLSVSYIFSELFLLSLYLMVQEIELGNVTENNYQDAFESSLKRIFTEPAEKKPNPEETKRISQAADEETDAFRVSCEYFAAQLSTLTPTERIVYEQYIAGASTKIIMEKLNITENTLKYHNKNIYSKLGVSSRRQLVEIAAAIEK